MRVVASAHDSGDEVGPGAGRDEGLGAVDDVVIAFAYGARLDAGYVTAGAWLCDRQRADLVAREGGLRVAVDEIRVAAADDVRQRDARGEPPRPPPTGPAVVEDLLVDDGGVDRVAALATDAFR